MTFSKFNKITFTSIIFVLYCITSFAQTEADIISKLRVALKKGAEDIPEPPTILKGTFKMGKMVFDGTIYYHKPNNRMELTMQGMTFISFTNDSISWDYNPITEEHTIKTLEKTNKEKHASREKAYDTWGKDLLFYKERNIKVKYLGKQKMDSLEVYALELRKKDKSKYDYYLDTRTNLIYKIKGEEGSRYYANYLSYEEYVYPSFMRQDFPGEELEVKTTFTSVPAVIADSLFIIPKEAFSQESKTHKRVKILIAQADSLSSNNDFKGTIQKYSEAINLQNNNSLLYNGRGLAKINNKEFYEAIADFNIALELDPKFSNAMNNRGLAKFYIGDNNGAVTDYTKAIEIDSTNISAYKNRGLIFLRSSQYNEASHDFLRSIKLKQDDGDSHFKYGVATAQLEKYEDALVSYRKAIQLGYRTSDLYNYMGVSFYKLNNFDSSALYFNKAVNMAPTNLQYLENYGRALYNLEDFNNAEKQFEKYLKIKNDNPEIHNMVGLCKYKDENYKGAIKDFTKSIELNEKGATYFDNRASAKEMIEDYVGAIEDYTRSINIYSNDARIYYKRGLIKIWTSKKIEGCLDLATANEMKYEPAKEAILKHCH